MMMFGDSDSDPEGAVSKLNINKDYANRYNKWRRGEEIQKLKDKYGDVSAFAASSESSSETEDDDAEALTPKMEQQWLKTLAALKSKNPKIYQKDIKFFNSDDENELEGKSAKKQNKKKSKKVTLKDMDRKLVTEKEGKYSDDSSDEEEPHSMPSGYYEEQEKIKKSIKEAGFGLSDDDDDDDDDGLLTERVRTSAEQEAEEEEYRKFIKGQEAKVNEKDETELAGLRDFWNQSDLTEDDKFLRDYILDKKYLDELSEDDSDLDDTNNKDVKLVTLSEEEDILEKQEQFEHKYNFRFEEPDQDFIKTYPRTVSQSMRSETNKRKEKRAKVKERKEQEKNKRKEELNRLKNLKRQEIEDRLVSIQQKSGAKTMAYTQQELEGDFDPEEHDRKMKEMFPEDDEEEEGDEKPQFEFDPEIDDNEDWDQYVCAPSGGDNEEDNEECYEAGDFEDPNFNMDADYDPNAATIEERNFGLDGRSKRSRRRKSRLKQALERKKPVFDPNEKTFDEYLEEYYGLEYEDLIGDTPCRFTYREVVPNDFGLSVDEILSAKDKELNKWCSLKKSIQYRSVQEEKKDVRKFQDKAKNLHKKLSVLQSVYSEEPQEDEEGTKKRSKKKRNRPAETVNNETEQDQAEDDDMSEQVSKKKKPIDDRLASHDDEAVEEETTDDRTEKPVGKSEQNLGKKPKLKSKKFKYPIALNYGGDSASNGKQYSNMMSFKRMEAYGLKPNVVKQMKKNKKRY